MNIEPTLRRIEEEYIGGRMTKEEYIRQRKEILFNGKKKAK